ncbi:cation-translocating P-type ATPase [Parasalinivibrio latis]|uniref:heavy metal translocating P-type ATPase n=1 Tax=Parasalinivibrio latis TaxID=2952610 RepID=UPI0030DDFCF9
MERAQAATRQVFWVTGMTCASCARFLSERLSEVPGVRKARVNFEGSYALVDTDNDSRVLHDLVRHASRAGYRLSTEGIDARRDALHRQNRRLGGTLILAAIFTMWSMLAAVITYLNSPDDIGTTVFQTLTLVSGIFSIPVVWLLSLHIQKMAWQALRHGRFNLDAMVLTGSWSAFVISCFFWWQGSENVYFDTAAMLMFIQLGGKYIDAQIKASSLNNLGEIIGSDPLAERIDASGFTDLVSVPALKAGDRIRLYRGDRIYIDGVLDTPEALLDISMTTGESAPVTVSRGEVLKAGCLNIGNAIELVVLKTSGETSADLQLLEVLSNRAEKPHAQKLADKTAAYFSNLIIILTVLSSVILLVNGEPVSEIAKRALAMLVIACPCALTLAIPLASQAIQDRALKSGILLNNVWALYNAGSAGHILLDKTGTLTKGSPQVKNLFPARNVLSGDLLSQAAALAGYTPHLYADAILRHARSVSPPQLSRYHRELSGTGKTEETGGKGIIWSGPDGQAQLAMGTRQFLMELGVRDVPGYSTSGCYIACHGRYTGFIEIADPLRKETPEVIAGLRTSRYGLAMLSGDKPEVCEQVSDKLGGITVFSECLPEDKQGLVKRYQTEGPVIFIGDGLNDNLALTQSDFGITCDKAAKLTQSCADAVILVPGLTPLPSVLGLAGQFRSLVRRNLTFALVYNFIALPVAASGIVSPLLAIGAMLLSSGSIMVNTWLESSRPHPKQAEPDRPQNI